MNYPTKNHNSNDSFIINAELVEDQQENQSPLVQGDRYDAQQVQSRIFDRDLATTTYKSICGTTVLAGLQITSTQYLHQIGMIGFFPAAVAGLPAGFAFSAMLSHLSFQEGSWIPSVDDRRKFSLSLSRAMLLGGSSVKLSLDAKNMESIALQSFDGYQRQVDAYEGMKPQESPFGLYVAACIALSIALWAFFRKK